MGKEMFAALPPVPASVEIAGEHIELTPLKVGEVPAFARAVQPIAASLSASPDWLAILAEHGEAVIAALAIATRRPVDWVAGLDLDEYRHRRQHRERIVAHHSSTIMWSGCLCIAGFLSG